MCVWVCERECERVRIRTLVCTDILYNTLFSREEIFAKNEFEIFSREDIFANILFTRKYLPAKISSRENIFPRKYLPANCFRAANMSACRPGPRLCGVLFHNLEAPT